MNTILKIDVDSPRKLSLATLRRRARIAHVVIMRCVDTRSPSGRGWHRVLEVEPAPRTAMEIVALQLIFGSDVTRECFNLHRARLVDAKQVSKFWRERWNNLYATSAGKSRAG